MDLQPIKMGSFLIKGAAGTVRSTLNGDMSSGLHKLGFLTHKPPSTSKEKQLPPASSHLSICLRHLFLQPCIRLRTVMFFHCLSTPLVLMLLYLYYRPTSPEFWMYFALHTTRCWLWILKNNCFPDVIFTRQRVTAFGTLILFMLLGLYWAAPWILASNRNLFSIPLPFVGFFVSIWGIGVAVNFSADAQKYFMLRERQILVKDGVFSRCRHPAYLGDLLSYASMTVLSAHWLPFLIYIFFFFTVFLPLVLKKEKNLARYSEWSQYKSQTGMLFPKVDWKYLFLCGVHILLSSVGVV
eukprot:jgi/Galph1/3079/GphlegSOOS_G1706.1